MVTKFELDELVQRCNVCIREWGHPGSFAEGSKQQVMWDAMNALCACKGLIGPAPNAERKQGADELDRTLQPNV